MSEKRVRLIVAGAGNRGDAHADYAKRHPGDAVVVGVAEPREFHRNQMATTHGIPADAVFADWKEMAARDRFADAVIISTQDAMHVEPVQAFAAKGYHILLEKPMAPDAEGCRRIVAAAKDAGVIFAVCHVLRYTPYTRALKEIIDSGAIGDIVNIQRLEPVGYWHQAHSYVRGNWRNEAESSFMLLAKSCHDIDWIHYIMGSSCKAVTSFGTLKHFRPEERPQGASDRCTDCAVEQNCPYSAIKIYAGRLERGEAGWPVDVVQPDATSETLLDALRTGPYGRCVYACDNDVVDNQVVNMLFENGATASFTMTGMTRAGHRRTGVYGTRGQLVGDGSIIEHHDFLSDETKTIDVNAAAGTITGGHGGGDEGVMQSFVDAVIHNDPSRVLTGPDETLDSHLLVFAAEEARLNSSVVAMG